VDGNDVVAVHAAAQTAVKRARSGDGPTLIECRTFRWRGHVGASFDLDVGVERRGELAEWLPRDPLRRVADELIERGVLDLERREQAINDRVNTAVEQARAAPQAEPEPYMERQEALCAR
jgi:pyruvate dehydrogenase E1 component alpha subunit